MSLVTVNNGLSGQQYLLRRLGIHMEAECVVRPEEELELVLQDGDVPMQDDGEGKVGDAAGIAPVPDLALELFITSLLHMYCLGNFENLLSYVCLLMLSYVCLFIL